MSSQLSILNCMSLVLLVNFLLSITVSDLPHNSYHIPKLSARKADMPSSKTCD